MSKSLKHAVTNPVLFADGDHVLVAVSGGADSMALLSALAERRESSLSVSAAHFDHQLRPEGAADAALVREWCDRMEIELYTGTGDVAQWAKERRRSIEEAARTLRYAFLEQMADRCGANHIVTAHTESDQVETILMRLLRGAGIRGLAGIPERRGRVVRPLLGVPGEATRRHCVENRVPFAEDPTNSDTAIARNRIRHEVLPGLRRIVPDIDHRLLRLGACARAALADARRRTDPVLEGACDEGDGVWTLDCSRVSRLTQEDRMILFADLVTRCMGSARELGRVHYDALVALSRDETATGKAASIPGYEVRRDHDAIVFTPNQRGTEGAAPLDGVELKIPGTTHVGGYNVCVELVVARDLTNIGNVAAESSGARSTNVAYFARSSVGLPLVARAPRPGDRMRPFGMRRGHKKLSDIFVDNGVPYRRRAGTLIVADRREVLWAVGVATSESVRVEPECRDVIRVTVTPARSH